MSFGFWIELARVISSATHRPYIGGPLGQRLDPRGSQLLFSIRGHHSHTPPASRPVFPPKYFPHFRTPRETMSRLKQRHLFSTIHHLMNHLMSLITPIAVSVQHIITGRLSCRIRRAERLSRFRAQLNPNRPKRNLRCLYVPTSRTHSCPTPRPPPLPIGGQSFVIIPSWRPCGARGIGRGCPR